MKRIAFVGDTHCGGVCGLWPRSWLPGDAPYTGPRYLADCFDHLVSTWPDVDVLFLMGDLIEGKNRKSASVGLHTAQIGRQVDGAIEVLRPLCAKADRVFRVWGTPYHEDFEDGLGKLDLALKVEKSQQVINLRLPTRDGGKNILNVAHHPPGGGAIYHGTKLDRQILWNIIASTQRKISAARWIVRAHVHACASMSRFGVTAITSPCWKLADPHAIKGNYEQWQPDLGGLLMVEDDLDPSGWRFIESPYDPPTEEVFEYVDVGESATAVLSKPRKSRRPRSSKRRVGR